MTHIKRISAAGIIDVVAGVLRLQSIIGGIINATETHSGAEAITLTGMVVNNIQQNLETGLVKVINHMPEFCRIIFIQIRRVRCEKT